MGSEVCTGDRAKKVLAVAVYDHYEHLNQRSKKDDIELGKSNILVVGPAGSSKTLLTRALIRLLNVLFTIADATTLAETDYVGEDAENIVQKLLQKCNYDVEKARIGIVYIDKIDKISWKSDNPSITRDVSGEGVQQTLLKLIKDTVALVSPQGGRKHPQQEFLQIDTRSILLVCGGAFAGLERVIQSRSARGGIGFNVEVRSQEMSKKVSEALKEVEPKGLARFGLTPEFVGCLPVIVILDELDEAALMQILTEPESALTRQYTKLFEIESVDLEFRPGALKTVAHKALERRTGARDLRSILEGILLDTMYEVPSQQDVGKVIIDKSIIDGSPQPLIIYENSEKSTKTAPGA